jgi:pimeloyl-ACP methyl ester carboxylesterase
MTPEPGSDMTSAIGPKTFECVDRPGGSVAFEVTGSGPLIVCVPGMGDLRSSYRFVQSELATAGYRVALMDLRGHGDSDATFGEYGDLATAGDIPALISELGGPAVIVGNSMAAGSAVLVAAKHPELVSGLVLVGPFVREQGTPAAKRLLLRAMVTPLWAAAAWSAYLPKLYAGTKPQDLDSYRTSVKAAIQRPGYAKAFSLTTRTRHDAAAAAIGSVTAPTLVIMGELDPDFPNPREEASWIADQLPGEVLMVSDAGHYPQSQRPDLVGPAIAAFARRVTSHA